MRVLGQNTMTVLESKGVTRLGVGETEQAFSHVVKELVEKKRLVFFLFLFSPDLHGSQEARGHKPSRLGVS